MQKILVAVVQMVFTLILYVIWNSGDAVPRLFLGS